MLILLNETKKIGHIVQSFLSPNNHKKVQRLMKNYSLRARIRRKRKYSSYQVEVGKK